ncbi:MAG: ABC transporter permease [Longimicrobiaceae bacterium]
MTNLPALRELTLTRVRVMLREPEVLFWVFGFPILLALGLGIAFRDPPAEPVPVALERGPAAGRFLAALESSPEVEPVLMSEVGARDALRRGEVSLVVAAGNGLVLRYDPSRPEGRSARLVVDRVLQSAAGATRPVPVRIDEMRQPGSRYIDWLIPGLVGFNLMSTGLWGIGFYVVQTRQNRQLKRLIATPMRRGDFLLAQILARLIFLLFEIPLIVLFAWLAFDVRVMGDLFALSAIALLGAACFAGLGLLASSRARTTEGVGGIVNIIMMPMLVLSGVFFSASRFPDAAQPLIRALPLTALNDALRAVYNDGLPLSAVSTELLLISAWMAITFFLALRWFRWQ